VPLPDYATAGAAGADLRANLRPGDRAAGLVLAPGARALVPTGLRVAIPQRVRDAGATALGAGAEARDLGAECAGHDRQRLSRSLGVILINLGDAPFVVEHGARIAQAVIAPVVQAGFALRERLDETVRGAGGFGSTGVG
jgi:dUTP pyrophosphatase